jgi:glycosyltransferase involved in cell wall biosynthesis
MGHFDVSSMARSQSKMTQKILFVVNADWFFLSHRLPIALAAKNMGFDVHVAVGITDKLDELEQYGFTVHPLKLKRSSGNFLDVARELIEFYQLFKFLKPDLVHLVTIKPVLLGGIAARLAIIPSAVYAISGLGYIFTSTEIIVSIKKKLASWLYKISLSHKNKCVVFQNESDRSLVTAVAKLDSSHTKLIRGSGVDLKKYKYLKLNDKKPIIMFAARLLRDKGIYDFISAATLLKKKNIDALFVLVGNIDLDNPSSLSQLELNQLINEEVVEYWGHSDDMPAVLSKSYMLVLPSYREGLPKVLIEAAAVGRAVVTTDVPGCRDAINPEKSGLLVPVRNPPALANAIEKLLKNPELCQRMGIAGRQLAEKSFNIDHVVSEHLDIYKNLMAHTNWSNQ